MHFTEAIQPHVNYLLTVAKTILRREDLAWDALQDSLVKLWQKKRPPQHLRNWLLRVVINQSLQLRRAHLRRAKHEQRAATGRIEGSRELDPMRIATNLELGQALRHALAELPEEYRTVFVLREIEDQDYASIAAVLQVPVGTVRSRLNRARASLKEILARWLQ